MKSVFQEDDEGENHIRVGRLNLVDLAGSERQSKTGATVSEDCKWGQWLFIFLYVHITYNSTLTDCGQTSVVLYCTKIINTVNQLLFATTFFFNIISINWFTTTNIPDPCCYINLKTMIGLL